MTLLPPLRRNVPQTPRAFPIRPSRHYETTPVHWPVRRHDPTVSQPCEPGSQWARGSARLFPRLAAQGAHLDSTSGLFLRRALAPVGSTLPVGDSSTCVSPFFFGSATCFLRTPFISLPSRSRFSWGSAACDVAGAQASAAAAASWTVAVRGTGKLSVAAPVWRRRRWRRKGNCCARNGAKSGK